MKINDDYYMHYILSLFKDNSSNRGQLENVFHGRRTPSMLFLIIKNNWFHTFKLFPKINRDIIGETLTLLLKKDSLYKINDKYYLSDLGKDRVEKYFFDHFYPANITDLRRQPYRNTFWSRFQLMTQIISEKQHKNRNYSPISREYSHQNWAKKTLLNYKDLVPSFEQVWIEESVKLFSELSSNSAYLLSSLLVGNRISGKTFSQVLRKKAWTEIETYILFNNAVEEAMSIIETKNTRLKILNQVLHSIEKENYYGLSKSSYKTALYIGRNFDLKEISYKRHLKINTIKEHILEIAFIQPQFDFKQFIPSENYKYLNKIMDQRPEITYKELKRHNKDLDFMHFRLVELERLRNENGFK